MVHFSVTCLSVGKIPRTSTLLFLRFTFNEVQSVPNALSHGTSFDRETATKPRKWPNEGSYKPRAYREHTRKKHKRRPKLENGKRRYLPFPSDSRNYRHSEKLRVTSKDMTRIQESAKAY